MGSQGEPKLLCGIAAALVSLCTVGCTGLEPAAIGAGASVAQTGVTVFERGKARTVERARYGDSLEAVRRTGEALALRRIADEAGPARARLVYHDDRGNSLVIVVERHTEQITMLQADVGVFGEIGLATLFLRQTLVAMGVASESVPPVPRIETPGAPGVSPPAR